MSGDVVWLDVLPSMVGFAQNLAKESTKAATNAGKQAGNAWSSAVASSAKGGASLVAELESAERKSAATVKQLSGQISQARAAERTATANVVLAEQKLADAREKYGEESAQAQAAELKLEAARAKAEGATKKFAAAEDALKAAQREHTEVTGQLVKANKDLADETGKQPSRWSRFKDSMLSGAEGAEKAKKSLHDVAVKAAAVGAAIVTAAAAVTAGAFNVGQVYDDMSDTIRIQTGASGLELTGLVDVARDVGSTVPVEFAKVGPVVADLNTRLGLTGGTLETVASQVLEAGRMLGQDVDIQRATAAFSAYKISGDQVIGGMDTLFRVSQATGVGINDLTDAVTKQAPALQNLGFGFEDTVALVGSLDKAGIDADATLAAMGRGLVSLAKKGEEPQAAFRRVTQEISDLVAKGDVASAIDLASGVFGTRAANQFVGAVQSGTLALDDLLVSAGTSSDTILGVAAETADFAETWQIVKNNALLALEPLGSKVFGAVGDALKGAVPYVRDFAAGMAGVASILFEGDFAGAAATFGWDEDSTQVTTLFTIRDTLLRIKDVASSALTAFGDYVTGTVIPAAKDLGSWLASNKDWLLSIGVAIGTVVVAWKAYQTALVVWQAATKAATALQVAFNAVMAMNPITLVVMAIAALVAGLVYFFTQTETGKQVWASFTAFLSETWATITAALTTAWNAISAFFAELWSGITGFFSAAWGVIQALFSWTPLGVVIENWGALAGWFSGMWAGIKEFFSSAWDFMKQVFQWTPIGIVTSNWDSIVGFFKGLPGRIRDAAKGMWDGITEAFKSAINAIIRGWNDLRFQLDGWTTPWGDTYGKMTIDTPNIPLLAAGGTAVRPGWAITGDAGPELTYMPVGAQVIPLSERGNAGAGNPWGAGIHIENAQLGGSLAELQALVEWEARTP